MAVHAPDRPEVVDAVDPGVEGNSRITAATGTLLTLLLLVEGFTVLDVRGYLTLHAALGLIVIGPVMLKCASTGYRFVRYYTGHAAYVRNGPPHLLLRALGPVVILSTLALLGTGVALLAVHGRSDTWLTLHQGSFIVWVAVMSVHFLAHVIEAIRGTARELRPAGQDPAGRGRTRRLIALAASLVIGVGLAAAFTPDASSWQLDHHEHARVQPR